MKTLLISLLFVMYSTTGYALEITDSQASINFGDVGEWIQYHEWKTGKKVQPIPVQEQDTFNFNCLVNTGLPLAFGVEEGGTVLCTVTPDIVLAASDVQHNNACRFFFGKKYNFDRLDEENTTLHCVVGRNVNNA